MKKLIFIFIKFVFCLLFIFAHPSFATSKLLPDELIDHVFSFLTDKERVEYRPSSLRTHSCNQIKKQLSVVNISQLLLEERIRLWHAEVIFSAVIGSDPYYLDFLLTMQKKSFHNMCSKIECSLPQKRSAWLLHSHVLFLTYPVFLDAVLKAILYLGVEVGSQKNQSYEEKFKKSLMESFVYSSLSKDTSDVAYKSYCFARSVNFLERSDFYHGKFGDLYTVMNSKESCLLYNNLFKTLFWGVQKYMKSYENKHFRTRGQIAFRMVEKMVLLDLIQTMSGEESKSDRFLYSIYQGFYQSLNKNEKVYMNASVLSSVEKWDEYFNMNCINWKTKEVGFLSHFYGHIRRVVAKAESLFI